MLLFPFICTYVNDINTTRAVINYEERERRNNQRQQKAQLLASKQFTKRLRKYDIFDNSLKKQKPKKKKEITYTDGDMLGYITIPSINIVLPIYEGTHDEVLQKGIGHLKQSKDKITTFPFLGKSKHCILTGHSGLSTTKLFSDLEKIKKGDFFYIKANRKFYQYKVRKIYKKLPSNAKKYLTTKKGGDYCTLITCIPIYVNTHRLLVRGERVEYDGRFDMKSLEKKLTNQNCIIVAVISTALILLIVVTQKFRRKGRKQ